MTKTSTKELYLSNSADTLIEHRRRWEEGTYAASNAELYALLGQTLDFYLRIRRDVGLSKALSGLLDTYGIIYNSSTSTALKVIRLVFAGKGRENAIAHRVFGYTKVLEVAAAEGVTGATLPDFIVERGGIDEIRRTSKNGMTVATRTKNNRDYAEVYYASCKEIASIDITDTLQPANGEHFSLALVRKNSDATGSIVFGTDNVSVLHQVLALAGSQLKKEAAEKAEELFAKNNETKRQQNLHLLAQEMQSSFAPKTFINQYTAQEAASA